MFSDKELGYLNDRDFLLTKREVMDKGQALLASVEAGLVKLVEGLNVPFPEGTLARAGKISRGENYKGLPYLLLDYPRLLEQDHVFALRTMLWWGHHFSMVLHLQGRGLSPFRAHLAAQAEELCNSKWLVAVGANPWEHHFEPDNFRPMADMETAELQELLLQKDFVKLGQTLPLDKAEALPETSLRWCAQLFAWLLPPAPQQ